MSEFVTNFIEKERPDGFVRFWDFKFPNNYGFFINQTYCEPDKFAVVTITVYEDGQRFGLAPDDERLSILKDYKQGHLDAADLVEIAEKIKAF